MATNNKLGLLHIQSNSPNLKVIKLYKDNFIYHKYHADFNLHDDIGVIICGLEINLNKDFLSTFKHLRVIGTNTTSISHIDQDFCLKQKIKIVSLRDNFNKIFNITSSVEIALGLLINSIRNIHLYSRDLLTNNSHSRDTYPSYQLSSYRIGILGLGRIGSMLKLILDTFCPTVYFYDSDKTKVTENNRNAFLPLHDLLSKSDIILICISWSNGDPIFLDQKKINKLKKGVHIINISRAEVIDEKCLVNNIKSENILSYASDVLPVEYEHRVIDKSPLIDLSREGYRVLITPHIGGSAVDAMHKTEEVLADLIIQDFA